MTDYNFRKKTPEEIQDKIKELIKNPINKTTRELHLKYNDPYQGRDESSPDEEKALNDYVEKGTKIRPKKPTDMDYQKIIMASLEDLKSNLMEAKIAIAHNHHIEWRKAKLIDGEKVGELEEEWYA